MPALDRDHHGRTQPRIPLQVRLFIVTDIRSAAHIVICVQGCPQAGPDPLYEVEFSGQDGVLTTCLAKEIVVVVKKPGSYLELEQPARA